MSVAASRFISWVAGVIFGVSWQMAVHGYPWFVVGCVLAPIAHFAAGVFVRD